MKAVILCGGQGTRIRDVSEVLPKPMLPIGGKPILWHIMSIYAYHGVKEFVLCLGYKGWLIKEFFLNYLAKTSDLSLTLDKTDSITYHNADRVKDWKVTLVDTGELAQTGARVWRIREHLKDCKLFSLTYGDGVGDIDIKGLIKAHQRSGLLATVTGVRPSGRFGEIETEGNVVSQFNEKPNVSSGIINGGYMIFDRQAIDKYFTAGDGLILETDVLPKMAQDKQLGIYDHKGAWHCIDTVRELNLLNSMWADNKAKWKIWG